MLSSFKDPDKYFKILRDKSKELNLAKRSGVSSFNEFNKNHEWLKIRSKQYNTE